MHHGQRRLVTSFLVVPLLVYVVFVVSPYLQAFYIALTDWGGFSGDWNFVGTANFVKLAQDFDFWTALGHNGVLLLILPVVTLALGLFFAFMLNVGARLGGVRGVRGSGIYRVVYFFPVVMSVAIIAILWRFVFNPRIGLLNGLLDLLGLDALARPWLGERAWALWAIIAVMVWAGVGFYVVLFTAAMKSIPQHLYEAARIDGAGRVQIFFRITVPLLRDTIQTAYIFMGIHALDAFAVVQIMTDGGPDGATDVIALRIYDTAFQFGEFGYSSAMGVVLFLLTLVLTVLTIRATRRERTEY